MRSVDIITQLCTLDDGTVVQAKLSDINRVCRARGVETLKSWQAAAAFLVACYTTETEDIIPSEQVLNVFDDETHFKAAMRALIHEGDDVFRDPSFMRHLQDKMFEYLGGRVPSITEQVDGFAPGLYVYFTTLLMRQTVN